MGTGLRVAVGACLQVSILVRQPIKGQPTHAPNLVKQPDAGHDGACVHGGVLIFVSWFCFILTSNAVQWGWRLCAPTGASLIASRAVVTAAHCLDRDTFLRRLPGVDVGRHKL